MADVDNNGAEAAVVEVDSVTAVTAATLSAVGICSVSEPEDVPPIVLLMAGYVLDAGGNGWRKRVKRETSLVGEKNDITLMLI